MAYWEDTTEWLISGWLSIALVLILIYSVLVYGWYEETGGTLVILGAQGTYAFWMNLWRFAKSRCGGY